MRASTKVLIFLIFLNSAAGVVGASGLGNDMGISPNPGNPEAVQQANETANSTSASSGFGSTLFGVYSAITQTYESFVNALFAGPIMFKSLGAPGWLVDFVFAPAYIVAAADIIYAISGRVI